MNCFKYRADAKTPIFPRQAFFENYAEARNWIDELADSYRLTFPGGHFPPGVAWKITDLETGETIVEVNP